MAGWQEHPSTRTRHFFEDGAEFSVCGRDRRTNGALFADGGFLPCSFCRKKLSKRRSEQTLEEVGDVKSESKVAAHPS